MSPYLSLADIPEAQRWTRSSGFRWSRRETAGRCPGNPQPRVGGVVPLLSDWLICFLSFQGGVSVTAEELQLLPEGADSAAPQLRSRTSASAPRAKDGGTSPNCLSGRNQKDLTSSLCGSESFCPRFHGNPEQTNGR